MPTAAEGAESAGLAGISGRPGAAKEPYL